MSETNTCRTCRYWQGILPRGTDTTWSGCMVGRHMLDMKRMLDPDWIAEVGDDNLELMGGNQDVVATRDVASCSKYKPKLVSGAPVVPMKRVRPRERYKARGRTQPTDAMGATLKVLSHNVYHKESPDESLAFDTILHYCWDKRLAD